MDARILQSKESYTNRHPCGSVFTHLFRPQVFEYQNRTSLGTLLCFLTSSIRHPLHFSKYDPRNKVREKRTKQSQGASSPRWFLFFKPVVATRRTHDASPPRTRRRAGTHQRRRHNILSDVSEPRTPMNEEPAGLRFLPLTTAALAALATEFSQSTRRKKNHFRWTPGSRRNGQENNNNQEPLSCIQASAPGTSRFRNSNETSRGAMKTLSFLCQRLRKFKKNREVAKEVEINPEENKDPAVWATVSIFPVELRRCSGVEGMTRRSCRPDESNERIRCRILFPC